MRARRRLLGLLGVLLSSLSSAVGLPWAALLGAAGCPWGHLCLLFGDLLGAPGVLCGWFFGGAGLSFHALACILLSFSIVSQTHQVLCWLCQDSSRPKRFARNPHLESNGPGRRTGGDLYFAVSGNGI